MRLARYTVDGLTRVGIVIGNEIADVGATNPDWPSDLVSLLAEVGVADIGAAAAGAVRYSLEDVRLEAPIPHPPELLAIGLNYAQHVAEDLVDKPAAPLVFNKQITCVTGPYDPIIVPTAAPTMVDYEGELGVVIGRRCRAVPRDRAHEVVAGYLVVNDVSVRDWQLASPTMTMGKSWDTHGPIGPWLVTPDEVPNPHTLRIQTWVDGELRQDAHTSAMLLNCWELIEHLSTAFTLLPGTIIATGTPAGVGMAMNPPGFLKTGQSVRIEVEGIGAIVNPVVAE